MKKILLGILILFLNSCHFIGKGNGINFTIENKSDFPIENVKFTTSEHLTVMEFDKIEQNKNISDFLSMKNNKSDGEYILEFTRMNGKKVSKGYGYYTNGGALDSSVKFEIKNDTITKKFSSIKY